MKYDKNLCAKEGLRTITAPKQILQPNKVQRTVPNQVLKHKKDLKIGVNCKF